MSQEAYCNHGGFRHQKRQKIVTTLVQLFAPLIAASCALAQTGKLSAEKQAKIEKCSEVGFARFEGLQHAGASGAAIAYK